MAAPMGSVRVTCNIWRRWIQKRPSFVRCMTIPAPPMFGGQKPLIPTERKRLQDETIEFPEGRKSLDEILQEQEANAPLSSPPAVNIGPTYKVSRNSLRDKIARDTQKRESLEKIARHRELNVPLDTVKDCWQLEYGPVHIKELAEHYGIFRDLFDNGYFYPTVPLQVAFDYDDELVTPVYRGNIIPPSEAASAPLVHFDCEEGSWWTLLLTNPDGHLTDTDSEYLHWMVGNIPGNDISSGEELCTYLQPFPPKGTGFHRHVFMLFKQNERIDFSVERISTNRLRDRTFKMLDFYTRLQDQLSPMGLAFFQSEWDVSVQNVYHNVLEMSEPVFEYQHPPPYHPPLKKYPHKEPFDRYYDRYRDKKDLAEEVLRKKLELISPFKPYQPSYNYPLVHLATSKKPSWLKKREELMHRRREQFKDLPVHVVK